eukprot:SAG31_NODE_4445_length_3223_cov_82.165173_3_plen_218_part_00
MWLSQVGLRWWNEILEDGQNAWKFEKVADPSSLLPSDSTLFWGGKTACRIPQSHKLKSWCPRAAFAWVRGLLPGLMLSTGAWSLLLVSAVIGLKLAWLMIVAVAVTLNCANVVGYFKCRSTAGDQLQAGLAQAAMATAALSASTGGGAGTQTASGVGGAASSAIGMFGGLLRSAAAGAATVAMTAARTSPNTATSNDGPGTANFRSPMPSHGADTPI